MTTRDRLTGRCLCARTRFEIDLPPLFVGHCHCESCRRQTASPFTTFVGAWDGRWRWLGEMPAVYRSSPGVERWFCPVCGAPVAYRNAAYPEETHFYASLLDDPHLVEPTVNFNLGEHLAWAFGADRLPAYDPAAEGEAR